jgi:hypothetical protein
MLAHASCTRASYLFTCTRVSFSSKERAVGPVRSADGWPHARAVRAGGRPRVGSLGPSGLFEPRRGPGVQEMANCGDVFLRGEGRVGEVQEEASRSWERLSARR